MKILVVQELKITEQLVFSIIVILRIQYLLVVTNAVYKLLLILQYCLQMVMTMTMMMIMMKMFQIYLSLMVYCT